MEKGFTLTEILVVMAITAIVGTMLVVAFTNTLRGNNKAQILSVIKQNGQAILENMDKTIRNADNVVCPLPDVLTSPTLVVVKDGIHTRYRFNNENHTIETDNPIQGTITGTTEEETNEQFIARVCSLSVPIVEVNYLTDTNPETGVLVGENPSFTRSRAPGYKDSITISFTLEPARNAPAVIRGQIDPVRFKTTVQLR